MSAEMLPVCGDGSRALLELARALASEARAPNTRRSYDSALRCFALFCEQHSLVQEPQPAQVCAFVAWLAEQGRSVATVERAMAALAHAATQQGLAAPASHPAVSEVLEGVRRVLGRAQDRKAAVLVTDLRAMSEALGEGLAATRDRAVLVLGFAAALRRAELVALDVGDLQFVEQGVIVTLRRSKTDQHAEGTVKAVPRGLNAPTCAVRCVEAWLGAARLDEGPLFRRIGAGGKVLRQRMSDRAVARLVKRACANVGLDPKRYADHSLRAGLATEAARRGKSDWSIMRQTGHTNPATLAKYVREARLWEDNAADDLGL